MNRSTFEASQKLVDDWNAKHAVGIDVDVVRDDGTLTPTKTRSVAWVASNQPLVQVNGIVGGYLLTRVKPVMREISASAISSEAGGSKSSEVQP